ncbi:GNAT family N-acetyltransferase [Jiella sp. MQZ9-1]|uniref:GNAT family N-acetyltransferase n=1 Tax=Jiella flava TaxID=2816857 RepID=A0A939JXU9_9HYPH|nr:GNAT family N-acetyltransferase [Jiella flava]MBO0663741.1 GNAT family N-acetyltransferase [Jiella flava]MCD2472313.1 GNAT family N-acetyltransferase [Jiella flava]
MRFFVRSAGKRDLNAISALLCAAWHDTYDGIYGPQKVAEITASWHSVPALQTRLTRPESEFIVADDGSRLGGMAFAASSDREKKLVLLHQLYVHPNCQGQGIGTALLEEILDAFPDATRLRLEVEAANAKAIAFYQAKGFVKVAETADCGPGSGMPAAVYERPLGG